ncbi:MAG: hypothetical protein KGN00_02525 [Chloroflexota bacterium]|nr:hypothetical protein [Chloroflexota bacterium]MDE3192540.1 hypothetical protein [Chloroflexota bacterium]
MRIRAAAGACVVIALGIAGAAVAAGPSADLQLTATQSPPDPVPPNSLVTYRLTVNEHLKDVAPDVDEAIGPMGMVFDAYDKLTDAAIKGLRETGKHLHDVNQSGVLRLHYRYDRYELTCKIENVRGRRHVLRARRDVHEEVPELGRR